MEGLHDDRQTFEGDHAHGRLKKRISESPGRADHRLVRLFNLVDDEREGDPIPSRLKHRQVTHGSERSTVCYRTVTALMLALSLSISALNLAT